MISVLIMGWNNGTNFTNAQKFEWKRGVASHYIFPISLLSSKVSIILAREGKGKIHWDLIRNWTCDLLNTGWMLLYHWATGPMVAEWNLVCLCIVARLVASTDFSYLSLPQSGTLPYCEWTSTADGAVGVGWIDHTSTFPEWILSSYISIPFSLQISCMFSS